MLLIRLIVVYSDFEYLFFLLMEYLNIQILLMYHFNVQGKEYTLQVVLKAILLCIQLLYRKCSDSTPHPFD